MYQAKNGFTLEDETAPGGGWKIRSAGDILTALLTFPAFDTVAEGFIWEALAQATENRKVYADINELARELAENYI